MVQELSFPGLGLSLELDRVAFYLPRFLGSRPVFWYGIIIAFAFLVALTYILKRSKVFGLDSDRVFDVVFIAIIMGIIGARLYYVAFSWDAYKDNPISILYTWEGGLAIYGGLILGLLGLIIGCKIRKVKLLPLLDLVVGGVLVAQAIGRWGNFVNIEAFGGNTTLPWGMASPAITSYLQSQQQALTAIGMAVDPTAPVHPTFFYESLWCLLGFVVILLLTKHRRFDGQLFLTYLAWYGIGRFFIEGLRTDSLMIGSFRVSQMLGLLCFIAAISVLLFTFAKRKKQGESATPLYVTTAESKELLQKHQQLLTKKKQKKEQHKPEQESQTKNTVGDTSATTEKTESDEQ